MPLDQQPQDLHELPLRIGIGVSFLKVHDDRRGTVFGLAGVHNKAKLRRDGDLRLLGSHDGRGQPRLFGRNNGRGKRYLEGQKRDGPCGRQQRSPLRLFLVHKPYAHAVKYILST